MEGIARLGKWLTREFATSYGDWTKRGERHEGTIEVGGVPQDDGRAAVVLGLRDRSGDVVVGLALRKEDAIELARHINAATFLYGEPE